MENTTMIPYIAYESEMSRHERSVTRWFIACAILFALLIVTNVGWLCYESQFETVTVTQEVEASADGDSDIQLNTVGGDYYGGESESSTNN